MFRSEEMRRVTIFGLNKDRDAILSKIQSLGMIQPINLKPKDFPEELKRPELVKEISDISDKLVRVSRINHILKLAPMKLKMAQSLFGLESLDIKKIKRKNTQETLEEANKFIAKHEEEAIKLENQHKDLSEKKDELAHLHEVVHLFHKIGKPLHMFRDSTSIVIISGRIATQNIVKLTSDLEKETEGYSEVIAKEENKKDSVVTVISLRKYAGKATFIAKKHGVSVFTFPKFPNKEDLRSWVTGEVKGNDSKLSELNKKIKVLQKKIFSESLIIKENISVLKERFDTLHNMLDSRNFFMTQGWVMAKKVEEMQLELEKVTGKKVEFHVEVPKDEEQEEVPVKLTNPNWLKPFEMLTELYSLPKYRDLDPTFLVGPLFIIYAAFMLTDAVYGLALFVMGVILYKKFSRYDEGFKYVCITIIAFGVMTMFFGVLVGGYFGDLPKYLFGVTAEQLAFWRDPLADPLYFLIVAISVGVVHINIGLLLGAIEDVRKKAWKTLVSKRLIWYLVELSVLLIVFKVPFGKWLAGASVLIIVIMHGPLGLMDITGLMGDMISYSRLFALGLATSGIALAVNLLAELLSEIPYVGFLFAILIFIIGHAFGFVMNAVGSFVHALRLQFVEFFGKFYEGGGDAFVPLKEERIYTEVKE